jgi:signal transduction histidine kinase
MSVVLVAGLSVDRNLIKRLAVGHAGIALVIVLGTVTAVLALRAAIRQNERTSAIDQRLASLEHLRSDAREIARSARRYLLTGDLKEQQRVFAIEKEMDDERKQLGSVGAPLDQAFDDYVSSIVRSMSADRADAGAALAAFEDELMRVRNPLGGTFDGVMSRQRADRDAARSSQRLARGAQWALVVAGALGVLLTAGGVALVFRVARAQSQRIRESEAIAERAASSRREFLAASKDLRAPLERITAQTARLRMSTREDHQLELLESISNAAWQVDYMLRELLDVTAIQAGTVSLRRELSDVATLVDRAIRQHRDKAQQRGIRLQYESQLSMSVYADRERIAHALATLVGLAIESARMDGEVLVSATPSDEGVRLVVEDASATVPVSSSLDDPAVAPATDLALHLIQRIVEAHGGRFGIRATAPGRTYWFTLPKEPSLLR